MSRMLIGVESGFAANGSGSNPDCFHMTSYYSLVKMAEILFFLCVLWFQMRRARLRRARSRRLSLLRLIILVFKLMDQERMTAAVALLSSRIIRAAVVERHAWARTRTNAFFPDIVGTWNDSEFKRNFRVSRDTFAYLCAELRPVLGRKFVVRKPISVEEQMLSTGPLVISLE